MVIFSNLISSRSHAPRPWEHLVLSVFLITDILLDVKWYLISSSPLSNLILPVLLLLNLCCAYQSEPPAFFVFNESPWFYQIMPLFTLWMYYLAKYFLRGWKLRAQISNSKDLWLLHNMDTSKFLLEIPLSYLSKHLTCRLGHTWPRSVPMSELWSCSCVLREECHVNLEINSRRNDCPSGYKLQFQRLSLTL